LRHRTPKFYGGGRADALDLQVRGEPGPGGLILLPKSAGRPGTRNNYFGRKKRERYVVKYKSR
jgi:hypothetical protein